MICFIKKFLLYLRYEKQNKMEDVIPHGDSCAGCPFKGTITFYESDGIVNLPACHALAIADFTDRQPEVYSLNVPYEEDTKGNLTRDLKVCNINL